MKLHLELMDFDEEELEVLRKYGRAQNGISRDILVPAEMPLHNLRDWRGQAPGRKHKQILKSL